MKIILVTPAPATSRAGNRATAERWAALLAQLGHDVTVSTHYAGEEADALVAIHAWRSAVSIERFALAHPDRPVIVLLAGTDLYRDLALHRAGVLRSLDLAAAIVGLHDLVGLSLEPRHRAKLSVVHQSAPAPSETPAPVTDVFEILVVGHLRAEKDPMRAAEATRLLPTNSRIRVAHFGRAIDEEWSARASAEARDNPRYVWMGEVDGASVGRRLARARAMVLSSVMEGGANVVSEAVVAGTPVLASAIPGSIGLLGRDYPGYFAAGDTAALADLMRRTEAEPDFLATLEQCCRRRAPLFTARRERDGLRDVLERVTAAGRLDA